MREFVSMRHTDNNIYGFPDLDFRPWGRKIKLSLQTNL